MALTAEDYGLSKNYPNPFNPSTTIRFAVRTAQHVSVRVYNTLGREVATVFNGVADANRMYEQTFDASALSSGTYFCVFRSQEKNDIQKMLLVK